MLSSLDAHGRIAADGRSSDRVVWRDKQAAGIRGMTSSRQGEAWYRTAQRSGHSTSPSRSVGKRTPIKRRGGDQRESLFDWEAKGDHGPNVNIRAREKEEDNIKWTHALAAHQDYLRWQRDSKRVQPREKLLALQMADYALRMPSACMAGSGNRSESLRDSKARSALDSIQYLFEDSKTSPDKEPARHESAAPDPENAVSTRQLEQQAWLAAERTKVIHQLAADRHDATADFQSVRAREGDYARELQHAFQKPLAGRERKNDLLQSACNLSPSATAAHRTQSCEHMHDEQDTLVLHTLRELQASARELERERDATLEQFRACEMARFQDAHEAAQLLHAVKARSTQVMQALSALQDQERDSAALESVVYENGLRAKSEELGAACKKAESEKELFEVRLRAAQQHGGGIDAEHRRYKARLMTVKKEKQLLAEHNLLLERQIRHGGLALADERQRERRLLEDFRLLSRAVEETALHNEQTIQQISQLQKAHKGGDYLEISADADSLKIQEEMPAGEKPRAEKIFEKMPRACRQEALLQQHVQPSALQLQQSALQLRVGACTTCASGTPVAALAPAPTAEIQTDIKSNRSRRQCEEEEMEQLRRHCQKVEQGLVEPNRVHCEKKKMEEVLARHIGAGGFEGVSSVDGGTGEWGMGESFLSQSRILSEETSLFPRMLPVRAGACPWHGRGQSCPWHGDLPVPGTKPVQAEQRRIAEQAQDTRLCRHVNAIVEHNVLSCDNKQ